MEKTPSRRLSKGKFDLLVTDFKMPKMNGIELIRRIRPLQPALAIILLSGFVDALGLDEKSTGADVVINKGAHEIPHLLRSVTRLLSRQPAKKPPASQKDAKALKAKGQIRLKCASCYSSSLAVLPAGLSAGDSRRRQTRAQEDARESAAQRWLSSLTLRQKVAQLIVIPFSGEAPNTRSRQYRQFVRLVRDQQVGGLILISRTSHGIKRAEPYALAAFLNRMQRMARIPLLVSGGFRARRLDARRFDHAVSARHGVRRGGRSAGHPLPAARSPPARRARSACIGSSSRWRTSTATPTIPIINIRSFGESPRDVSAHVRAFIDGAHSDAKNRVLTTAKHFPGHGDTAVDSHLAMPSIHPIGRTSKAWSWFRFAPPSTRGVDSVMTAHIASTSDPPPGATATSSEAQPESSTAGGDGAAHDLHEPHSNVLRYATSLTWRFPTHEDRQGWIDFVPAGRQSASYGSRMNAFSWANFYDRLGGGGFIEALKNRMKAEYDYVLIDSRTGVSDTSGVCTVQLPDVLAVCFTLNRQSVEGAGAVAASVQAARSNGSASPLRIFPIPTRVEKAEKEKLDLARDAAADQFASVLAHVDESKWKEYWGDVEVLYEPFYAYEEVLATFRDALGQPASMLASMERITSWLTDGRVTRLVPAEEGERQRALARYSRQSRKARGRGAASTDAELQYYISYARADLDESLERFFGDLEREVRTLSGMSGSARVGFVDLDIAAGTDWQQQLESAVQRSRVLVPMYSPAYFASENTGREFQHFINRTATQQTPILPVIWVQPPAIPPAAGPITYTSPTFPEEYKNLGLRSLLRLRRYDDTYQAFLTAYAQRLVEVAHQVRLPAAATPPLAETSNAFATDPGATVGGERVQEPSQPPDGADYLESFIGFMPTLDRQSLEEACESELIPYIKSPRDKTSFLLEFTPPSIERLLANLSRRHLYGTVERVLDALPAFIRRPQFERFRALALISQNKPGAALPILKSVQGVDLTTEDKAFVAGLVGEASKRLYVDGRTPLLPVSRQNAIRAIRAYKEAYALNPSALWWGINVASLLRRLDVDSVPVPEDVLADIPGEDTPVAISLSDAARGAALDMFKKVQQRVDNGEATFWDFAVAAQSAIELGLPDDVATWTASSIRDTDDAFSLSEVLYQLTDVWRLEVSSQAGRYALPLLHAAVLKRDHGALSFPAAGAKSQLLALASIDRQFVRLMGNESMDLIDWYRIGLELTQYLAQIETHDGRPRGAGVLIRGEELGPDWDSETYLITSTSLLWPSFDGTTSGQPSAPSATLFLGIGGMVSRITSVLFTSPPSELDVTVARLEGPHFASGASLVPAQRPPFADGRNRAYVIGYPPGRPTLSMMSRQVLDHDATRIHLTAPAVGDDVGIGSPVFNREWELIGIISSRDARVPKLNGKPGTYRATEVRWIGAIRDAIPPAKPPPPPPSA